MMAVRSQRWWRRKLLLLRVVPMRRAVLPLTVRRHQHRWRELPETVRVNRWRRRRELPEPLRRPWWRRRKLPMPI